MQNITKEAYNEAIKVLEKCLTPSGFRAAYPGYNGIWARDSVISSLGASLLENKFKETFKQSLITLAKNQSEKGQIPNAILLDKKQVDYKSIDSTLWFIIGHYIFRERYKDASLFKKYKKSIEDAITWLSYQDMGEDSMLEQLPTTDWQDAYPHRYGHTINTQALWFYVLNLVRDKKEAVKLKSVCNNNKEDSLWNGRYYYSYRWKNHNKYKEIGDWFDSLGNLLAIIFELADKDKAEKILDYIKNEKIDEPYPIKAIYPAIERADKYWHDYFADAESKPLCYLNGGIWTYIGGFYILALLRVGRLKEAEKQLGKLAEANLLNPKFSEWLNGKTGEPGISRDKSKAGNQAWNAGMYILAYESLKSKKVLI